MAEREGEREVGQLPLGVLADAGVAEAVAEEDIEYQLHRGDGGVEEPPGQRLAPLVAVMVIVPLSIGGGPGISSLTMRQKTSYHLRPMLATTTFKPVAPFPDAVASGAPRAPGTDRIVEAGLRVLARYGLAKLTLDDVAREAGYSRATLYRYFPSKGALLREVVESESARLRRRLDEALAEAMTLQEALVAVAGFGAREFAAHDALQFLLAYEPGAVLPHLCFGSGDRLLDVLTGCVAPHLCRFLPPLEARRVAEWLARIVLSYGVTPPPALPGGEAAVVALVREFALPGLEAKESHG